MLQIYQIWQLLKSYVSAKKLQDIQKFTSMDTVRKIVKKTETNNKFAWANCQQGIILPKLQKSLQAWTETGNAGFIISDRQLWEEIYDSLSNAVLTREILAQLIDSLIAAKEFRFDLLFQRLADFYHRWCRGDFIDAAPNDNLPQQKMMNMVAQNIAVGIRQIDIQTGLNVLILLLELHRHAQKHNELRQHINFYPSTQPDTDNFFTSQLLRVINYSDALEIGNFSSTVGEFLRGGNFEGAYLGDANLVGVNFSGANLTRAYLGDANLTGANLSCANLTRVNFGDANLSGANLSGADLSGADLSGANLSGANLNRADLNRADLGSSKLQDAELCHANLTGTNLKDAEIGSANLSNAILFGANLSDAFLSKVNLSHADLCRADLSGANLSQAILNATNLSDTILFSTNLSEAVLIAADLSYAKLNGAKLNNAQLNSAMFMGADLSGVDLSNVVLNEADLTGVNLNEADLHGADLTDAILLGTDLSYANLNYANLSGSNLSGAILNGADLSHSNLSYAILGGADVSDANLAEMTWGEKQQWEGVRGLETAINVPIALKQQLRLR